MIQPNELRIGNKLQIGSQIVTVAELYSSEFKTPEEGFLPYGHDDISGIPLTEDWLIKFGFVKKFTAAFAAFDLGKIRIYLREGQPATLHYNADRGWYPEIKEINYVHEVQNFMKEWTGKELTEMTDIDLEGRDYLLDNCM